MKKLLIAAAVLALAGCHSTWNGVKADSSRIVGRSVSGIGHGIGKAGAALERSGRPEVLFFRRPLCGMIAA